MFGSEPWLISIGNNVHIVSGCHFVNHDGGVLILRQYFPSLEICKRINIGNDVYIGLNCIIMPGVNIGNNVVIGAGSVVTRDIPDNSVAAGVPAKVIKSTAEYCEKLLAESLGFGDLSKKDREKAVKEHYGIKF